MGKTKNRIFTLFIGILVCLIILEVSLRVVGLTYAHLSESDKGMSSDAEEVVLCIGDSVTFGIGASRELSYPAQLQNMLDKSDLKKKYRVINRGWPGQNTARLLTRLERYLQEFKPDIVTILIGAQNQANYFGYRQYLQESSNQNRGFFLSLHDSLDKVRIYKFVRLLIRDSTQTVQPAAEAQSIQYSGSPGIKDRPGEYTREFSLYLNRKGSDDHTPECVAAMKFKLKGDYDKALASILSVDEPRRVESECCYIAGSIYSEKKLYNSAMEWFIQGIERDQTQFANYEGIGELYLDQGKLKNALLWFKKGFEQARYETLHKLCYVGINVVFEEMGDIPGAIDFFENEIKRQPLVEDYLHTLANDYLLMFRKNGVDSEVQSWIEADIKKIVDLCSQYDARVVLQNYPVGPMVNHIIERIVKDRNILFVDHQTTFAQYVKDSVRSPNYFVPDGHPNARGYYLMAKNLWMVLKD